VVSTAKLGLIDLVKKQEIGNNTDFFKLLFIELELNNNYRNEKKSIFLSKHKKLKIKKFLKNMHAHGNLRKPVNPRLVFPKDINNGAKMKTMEISLGLSPRCAQKEAVQV